MIEAACRLAQRYRCQIVGIDRHNAADYATAKAKARRLAGIVTRDSASVRPGAPAGPAFSASTVRVACAGAWRIAPAA